MNTTEPLGLPRGSVRAILTILLVLVSALTLFVPVVGHGAEQMFLLLTAIAVRDYFGHRAVVNAEDGPVLPPPAINR